VAGAFAQNLGALLFGSLCIATDCPDQGHLRKFYPVRGFDEPRAGKEGCSFLKKRTKKLLRVLGAEAHS
jgi:hypothetical protein